MRELYRTADPVKLSFVRAVLSDAGIECQVLDEATSNLFIGAIPRRLVVADADWFQASRLLINAPDLQLDE